MSEEPLCGGPHLVAQLSFRAVCSQCGHTFGLLLSELGGHFPHLVNIGYQNIRDTLIMQVLDIE